MMMPMMIAIMTMGTWTLFNPQITSEHAWMFAICTILIIILNDFRKSKFEEREKLLILATVLSRTPSILCLSKQTRFWLSFYNVAGVRIVLRCFMAAALSLFLTHAHTYTHTLIHSPPLFNTHWSVRGLTHLITQKRVSVQWNNLYIWRVLYTFCGRTQHGFQYHLSMIHIVYVYMYMKYRQCLLCHCTNVPYYYICRYCTTITIEINK